MKKPLNGLKLIALYAAGLFLAFQARAQPSLAIPPTTESIEANGGKIMFTFDEIMSAADLDITWEGAGIEPGRFQCKWVTTIFGIPIPPISIECTYTGSLPSNVEVTYTLNRNNSGRIQSALAEELPETTGMFRTPGGGPDPCEPSGNGPQAGRMTLFKEINYLQTGNADPVFDLRDKATFFASVVNPTGAPPVRVVSATLGKPDGSKTNLTRIPPGVPSLPEVFVLSSAPPPEFALPTFDSEAALNQAFPNGVYTMLLNLNAGSPRAVNLRLLPAPEPPAPKFLNPGALEDADGSQPVTLRWNAFTGATANDGIDLQVIESGGGAVFQAPDECRNIQLRATDTSIMVPAATFQPGRIYTAQLTFFKVTHTGTNSVPGFVEFAGLRKTTRLGAEPPRLEIARIGDQIVISWTGNFILEAAQDVEGPWATAPSQANPQPVDTSVPQRFFRLRSPTPE